VRAMLGTKDLIVGDDSVRVYSYLLWGDVWRTHCSAA
jgi:hypothetical protein